MTVVAHTLDLSDSPEGLLEQVQVLAWWPPTQITGERVLDQKRI